MSNVVSLCEYRSKRAGLPTGPLTDDRAYEIAISSHLVDAVTGAELAGVAMPQLVMNAPTGEAFLARRYDGAWYWVDPSPRNVERMQARGWHLQQVRLVPDVRKSDRRP